MCLIANFGFLLPSFCRGRQTLVAFFRNTEYGSGRCFPKRKSECVIRRREIDTGQARTPPVLQGIKEETMILSCIYSLILSKVIGHILLPDLIIGAMRLTAPMTPPNSFLCRGYHIFMLLLAESRMEYVLQIWSDCCCRYNKGQRD